MVGGSAIEAELLWYGLAPSTRRAYEGHALAYTYFAQLHRLPSPYFPASPSSVSAWIAWEANEITRKGGQLFSRTLERKVAGLRSWHIDLGFPGDIGSPRLDRVIAGAMRKWGTASRPQPLPLTLPILLRVCEYIRKHPDHFGGPLTSLALRTSFALAFACFLRKAEFTYSSFSPDRHLCRSSVSFSRSGDRATLRLPASKTDPGRKGLELPIAPGSASLCPLRLLRKWFASVPAGPNAPLFSVGALPFTGERVVSALRLALSAVGYQPLLFTGHSFRSGAATWAASIGVPSDRIKIMGRWEGESFRRYIRLPLADHLAASTGLFTTPVSQSTLPADGVPLRHQVWAAPPDPLDDNADEV